MGRLIVRELRPILPSYIPPSPGDPYWANVVSLLHFDGGYTDDALGGAWTIDAGMSISTAITKFGSGALAENVDTTAHMSSASSKFSLGTGDFTIECHALRASARAQSRCIFWIRGASGDTLLVYSLPSWSVFNGSANSFGTIGSTNNTWQHIALVRASGTATLFIDGASSVSLSSAHNLSGATMHIGQYTGQSGVPALDEFRVTAGIARYTGTFTPPTAPFPNHA